MAPDPRTDADLVDAANAGDAEAFAALYERYRDWVMRLAWRLTGDGELALDVMQDTFLDLLRRFPGFELRAKLTTFLYPIVRHRAIDLARKARRRSRGAAAGPAPLPPPEPPEDLAVLEAAMRALPEGQREVVILRFAEDLSLKEIAAALALPVGTVKSRLHHALRALAADPRLGVGLGREPAAGDDPARRNRPVR